MYMHMYIYIYIYMSETGRTVSSKSRSPAEPVQQCSANGTGSQHPVRQHLVPSSKFSVYICIYIYTCRVYIYIYIYIYTVCMYTCIHK